MANPSDTSALLACPECKAPLAITTYPGNGYNEWSVVCSVDPHGHHVDVYDWPSEPVPIPDASHREKLEAALREVKALIDDCAERSRKSPNRITYLPSHHKIAAIVNDALAPTEGTRDASA